MFTTKWIFLLVKDLTREIIPWSPFTNLLQPLVIDEYGIKTKN